VSGVIDFDDAAGEAGGPDEEADFDGEEGKEGECPCVVAVHFGGGRRLVSGEAWETGFDEREWGRFYLGKLCPPPPPVRDPSQASHPWPIHADM